MKTKKPIFDAANDIVLGQPDGATKLVWFLDFTGLHSKRIRDVLIRAAERFGNEDISLAIRVIVDPEHAGSEIAARAALAAQKQNSYFPVHAALFEANHAVTLNDVLAIASDAGLDTATFEEDMYSEQTTQSLAWNHQAMNDAGVSRTPALFIDGRLYKGSWDETALIEAIEKPLGVRLHLTSQDFFHWAASAGVVLVLATLAALAFNNLGFHTLYEKLLEFPFGLSFGSGSFILPLELWINDGLMALFFLLIGIEIKRELVSGELSDMSRAILPILGAIGGMVMPVLLFLMFNIGLDTAKGWGIPMATDIAFTLGILALLGSKVPASLKVFISALAIADDLGAIVVIALFYGHGMHFDMLAFSGIVFLVMMGLNRARVYARIPYLLLGIVLWYFVYKSGIHATLAGVLTALAIPSRPAASIAGVAAQTAALFQNELKDHSQPAGHGVLAQLQANIERLREGGFRISANGQKRKFYEAYNCCF